MIDTTNQTLKFVKTHPDAVLPERKHKSTLNGDTGYDVTAVEDTLIPARGSATVPVGLVLADMPDCNWIRLESRSGLKFRHNVHCFPGVIDCNYRGSMDINLNNSSDVDYQVRKGDRIAQLALYPLIVPETQWASAVTDTDRGANGFGSTGR